MKASIDLTCPKATAAAPHGVSLLRLLLFSPAVLYAEAQPGQEASGSSFGLHANFNPAMAIVVVVLACAIIFIVFFSIFLRQCTGSSGGGPSHTVRRGGGGGSSRIASGGGRGGEKLSGLDRTAIDAFPILLYSAAVKGLKTGAGGVPECAVCLSEFDGGETLRLLPKCDHAFHPDCISLWLSSHTTCPVCRSNLSQPEDSGDRAGDLTETSASNQSDRNPRSGLGGEPRAHHISISVYGEERGESRAVEAVSATQTLNLTRSHSTGHSLSRVQPPAAAEDWERHALSLPEDVRRKLTRAASSGGGIYRGASVPLSDGRGLTEA